MKRSWLQFVIMVPLVLWLCLTLGCQKKVKGGITEEEARTIGNWFLKSRNEADLALLDKIYSPGIIVHDPSQPENIVGLDFL